MTARSPVRLPAAPAWLLVAALLGACAGRTGPIQPPIDPHAVAAEVVDGVVRAAAPDAEFAEQDWRAAHARFERDLEPMLRERHGDRAVAELEYGFGLVRHELGTPSATETARRLGEQVAALCADLPAAPAPAQES